MARSIVIILDYVFTARELFWNFIYAETDFPYDVRSDKAIDRLNRRVDRPGLKGLLKGASHVETAEISAKPSPDNQ